MAMSFPRVQVASHCHSPGCACVTHEGIWQEVATAWLAWTSLGSPRVKISTQDPGDLCQDRGAMLVHGVERHVAGGAGQH